MEQLHLGLDLVNRAVVEDKNGNYKFAGFFSFLSCLFFLFSLVVPYF
jgi:hypothetical protein